LILPEKIENTVELIKKGQALSGKDKVQLVFDPTLDQSVRALVEANLLLALQSVMIEQAHKEIQTARKKLKSSGVKLGTVADVNHFAGLIDEKAVNGVVLPNPIQQTVPAWALFGMFFIVIPMANSMIRDRKLGVFKRLLSFPVFRGQLLAGKILPFLLLNILQFALMFGVGVFVLPRITNLHLVLDFSYWHLLAVTAACAFAATSYGLMVSCLSKTAEQASAFGALSVVILAILGGVMIPRFVMPDFMQKISKISPLHWGLEAYLDIIVRKAAFTVTLEKILVLLAFGLLCLVVARAHFRWSESE
jgi:ABC-2 type transport system permease protein